MIEITATVKHAILYTGGLSTLSQKASNLYTLLYLVTTCAEDILLAG